MDLKARQKEIVKDLGDLSDWEARYKKIISLGKALTTLPEIHKVEDNRVKGCQSQVWMVAQLNGENHVIYEAESDAMIVNGLIALLLKAYSGASPDEILNTPPEFFKALELTSHLSPSRANGLHAMLRQMFYYAKAFQTLLAVKARV